MVLPWLQISIMVLQRPYIAFFNIKRSHDGQEVGKGWGGFKSFAADQTVPGSILSLFLIFFQVVNKVPLHTAFHYHPPINKVSYYGRNSDGDDSIFQQYFSHTKTMGGGDN